MMLQTLRGRLTLSHLSIIFLGIPLLSVVLIFVLEKNVILVNLSTQLTRQAALLADFSADNPQIWEDPEVAQTFVDRFQNRMTAQLMLVRADGRLMASSNTTEIISPPQILASPGFKTVIQGENSVLTNYSQDIQAEVADIWVPVFDREDQVIGAVRLTHQLATIRSRFIRLRMQILGVMSIGLIIGAATAWLLASRLKRPIDQLTLAVYNLASGDDLQPIPEQGPEELRLLAGAFNSLIERLQILKVGRRQLLANLIHELGRPLGALRSASQALLDGADEQVALRHQLIRGIDAELAVMQRLLDDLRRFYQRNMGHLELHTQPVDLNNWLPAILGHWRELAYQKGIKWRVELPAALPPMDVDPDRLAQAIGNLVSNAIKFTPQDEQIVVKAGRESDTVWISIRDTGIGISQEDKSRLFTPFFRGTKHSRLPEGMGLGLTIARDLIVAHDGRLTVSSPPDGGTLFTLWLPL